MQSMIEQSYALGEAVSVSLIVKLLKCIYAKIRTRESVLLDMSNVSRSKKDSIDVN